MRKLAKTLYTINSITCIFIGLMHTNAHFQDLVTAEVAGLLNHEIVVSGINSNIYDLWQGMSLMMGLLLIIIGLLHLLIIRRLEGNEYPPIEGSLIMILMLDFVIYTGYYFFSSWQVYGGVVGIIIQSICMVLTFRKK